MNRRALAPALLLLALLPAPAEADLDVGIPPGLPFEWEQADRPVTGSLGIPKRKEPDKGTKTRGSRRFTSGQRPGIYAEKTTAMGYARVTTVDILGHLMWIGGPDPKKLELPVAKGRTRTGGSGKGERTQGPYPPQVTLDLYWINFAMFLRECLHPNLVSDLESLERLVETGYPALVVMNDLAGQPFMKQNFAAKGRLTRWLTTLAKRVGPMPRSWPRAKGDDDPRRAMLLRLTADDLASGYAQSLDSDFAARVLSLPAPEGLSLLAEYADPKVHVLLNRNAVALLGAYRGPAATSALERALASSDQVTRLRAFVALARVGSPEAQRVALAQTKRVPAPTAVHILGVLRAKDGVKRALKLLKKGSAEGRMIAVRALARIGRDKKKKVTKALKRTLSSLRKMKPAKLDEKPAMRADVPDPPGTKRLVFYQLCVIALARLGSDAHVAEVFSILKQTPARDPKRPFARRNPVASPQTFGSFTIPSLAFLVESLEHMPEPALARLKIILEDRVCDVGLRMAALAALERKKALNAAVVNKLLDDSEPAMRAAALERLEELDRPAALRRAQKVLEAYVKSRAQPASPSRRVTAPKGTSGQEAVAAARILAGAAEGPAEARTAQVKPLTVLKAEPRDDAKPAGRLLALMVEILERKGDWYKVRATGVRLGKANEGWVKKDVLTLGDASDVLLGKVLTAARPKPPPKPTTGQVAKRLYGNPTIEVEFPVAEAAARALRDYATPAASTALLAALADPKHREVVRGAAAASLAAREPTKPILTALVKALSDEKGWVRYCAYRALRHLGQPSSTDHFCDWIYGTAAERAEATGKWQQWVAGK